MAGGYATWPLIRFGVIGEAWKQYKKHWVAWSLAMLIVMTGYSVITAGLFAVLDVGHVHGPGGFRLFLFGTGPLAPFFVSTAVSSFFVGGMVRVASNQLLGRAPRVEDLLSVGDVWFDLLLVSILNAAATSLGFMVCWIPGFIISGLFMLAIPLVVESRLPATGALIQSWNALKSQWLLATAFHWVLIIASASGVLLCGIGILLTGPLYCLSIAILYREFFPAMDFGTGRNTPSRFPKFDSPSFGSRAEPADFIFPRQPEGIEFSGVLLGEEALVAVGREERVAGANVDPSA